MKGKGMIFITVVFGFLFAQSCYYDNEQELYPDEVCDVANVTFQGTVMPIIQTNCAISGCHVAGTGRKVFTTYAGVKEVVDDGRLESRAVTNRDMPPSGPLPTCEISQIQAWLDQGAPNN